MSIDSYYEGVIAKLTKQGIIVDISKKLLSLTTNDQRVLYVHSLIESQKAFPTIKQVKKCQKVSVYYRNLGNKYYQKSENHMAWQYYNLSLLHAPTDSEHYSLALSNRSAVFLTLNNYKECSEDIKMVFAMQYPKSLKDKLEKRLKQCEEVLLEEDFKNIGANADNKSDDLTDMLTLGSSRDSRYLCASSKLKVVYTEEMGRHVIAKEDINVGEILAQENPYFVLLLKSQSLFTCSYCLSRKLNLIPCQHCCFVLYCSQECKENAWKEYHAVECPLMATLVYMEFTKLELLALRTAIKARNDHTNWMDLFKTIEDAESMVNTDQWGHVKVDDKWVYDSKYYASIHTLASNVDRRSISDIFQKSVTAAVFLELLTDGTEFLKSDDEELKEKIRNCVAGVLLLHVMTSPTNMHNIGSNMQDAKGNYVDEVSVASAPYAFHSLLNHSCAPNVVRFNRLGTGQTKLFALRPIKKGMQLFDNYGAHHALEDRASRQQSLKFQYKFACLCEACVNNWPTYMFLGGHKKVPRNLQNKKNRLLDSDAMEKLQKGDQEIVRRLFKPLCELASALEPYAPCQELADCQESLKQCLAIVEGLVPYGYRSKLEEPKPLWRCLWQSTDCQSETHFAPPFTADVLWSVIGGRVLVLLLFLSLSFIYLHYF